MELHGLPVKNLRRHVYQDLARNIRVQVVEVESIELSYSVAGSKDEAGCREQGCNREAFVMAIEQSISDVPDAKLHTAVTYKHCQRCKSPDAANATAKKTGAALFGAYKYRLPAAEGT
jgi:hypothetical protein